MKFEERALARKVVFEGNLITVCLDRVRLPNGREATREVVSHPGAVAVIAFTPEGELLLVRQYRYPIGQETLELPAGKLDPKEPPKQCALRELEEETGYRAKEATFLGKFYTTPGFSDEVIHLFKAEKLQQMQQNCDEDEFIDVVKMSLDQAKEKIAAGEIVDGKSIIGIFWPLT